jgi:hypothetical protein
LREGERERGREGESEGGGGRRRGEVGVVTGGVKRRVSRYIKEE